MTNDPRGLSRVEAPSLRSDPDATRRRRDGHLLEEGTTRNTTKSTCRHEFAPKNLNVSGAFEVWIPVVAFSKACIPSKLQSRVRRPRLTGAHCAAEAKKNKPMPTQREGRTHHAGQADTERARSAWDPRGGSYERELPGRRDGNLPSPTQISPGHIQTTSRSCTKEAERRVAGGKRIGT